jgi:type IV secretion system protein VirD4
MIQRLKEEAWFKPLVLSLGALTVLVLWSSLAGAIFLTRFNQQLTWALPVTLYRYWYYYDNLAYVHLWIRVSATLSAMAVLFLAFVVYSPKKQSPYGDAKLATRRDLAKAGLFADDGILVGKVGNDYLKFDGDQHVQLRAPTGEGKGTAVVVPNALAWKTSMLAFDLKGELEFLTSGYRAQFQSVFVFAPLSETYRTNCYNPLAYIPEDQNLRINEIQKLGNLFIPDSGNKDPIWTATPRNIFLGLILMLLETPDKPVTLGQMLRETLVEGDGSKYFARVVKERQESGNPLSMECVMALNSYISIEADVTRAGIMGGFRSRFELWMNPLIDAATSRNDFDLRMVRKTPMTIYVSVTQDNLDRLAPLINLFFQQFIDLNTRVELKHIKGPKCNCLLVLDEEAALGKIPALAKGIAYLRSYGIRILSIFQSMSQVIEIMNREGAKNYTANHAMQIVYAPKASEMDEAEEISKWLGETTIKVKNENGKGYTQKPRRLKMAQEIVDLGQDKEIIVKRGMPPAIVTKIEYYSDANFKKRLLPPIEIPVINMEEHNRLVFAASEKPRTALILALAGETVRPVKPEDVPNLGNLALNDFVLTFSKVDTPILDTIDMEALHAYADMRCREAGINVE